MVKSPVKTLGDIPILPFKRQEDWAAWLHKYHAQSPGIWLKLAKSGSGVQSVSYTQALQIAICYGWIDGQKRSFDGSSWLQKFAPRGAKSNWSKINREKAEELIRNGQMKPAGLKAVERAKRDGRWEMAYDSPGRAAVPSDLQAELARHPKAQAFFSTLNSVNRYAILYRIQTAKRAETRAKRIERFVRMLEREEKLHP